MLGHGAIHLPVGANITPVEATPRGARELIGLRRPLVVSLFGRNHPSRALEYAEAAILALAQAHGAGNLTVLNLGADAPPIAAPAGVEVRNSGPKPGSELSLMLSASDLMLLPLADGVSTRRSTLMAAFAHRLPVVGLRGKNTDQVLLDAPDALVLTPVGDRAAFALAVVELSTAPERMHSIGEAGRRLYEERFDWPVAAALLTTVLESVNVRSGVLT
jgi:glycosyltransferase involved in cell wall biosynthesis